MASQYPKSRRGSTKFSDQLRTIEKYLEKEGSNVKPPVLLQPAAASYYSSKPPTSGWRPTLRPAASKACVSASQELAPAESTLPDSTEWPGLPSRESGSGSSKSQREPDAPGPSTHPWRRPRPSPTAQSPGSQSVEGIGSDTDKRAPEIDRPEVQTESQPSISLLVDSLHESACIEALLRWLNSQPDGGIPHPMTEPSCTSLVSAVAGVVNITSCDVGELSAMRCPWGDRSCCIEPIAAWSTDDGAFCWRLENWRTEMQKVEGQEEKLLLCSTFAPSEYGSKKYMLVCRFSFLHQATLGQCYVISCPPSVLPLRFASIAPKFGQELWKLQHQQVLPLPH